MVLDPNLIYMRRKPVVRNSAKPKSLIAAVLLMGSLAAPQQPSSGGSSVARDTVAVDFSMDHTNSSASDAPFRQGETIRLRFTVRDKISGAPLNGLHPAAWLDLHGEKDPVAPVPCKQRVQKLLNANFLAPPEIDLNGYYVLVMNADASISVVDPQFSSGAARTVVTIPLPSPAIDWQLSDDQKLLFVAMPVSEQIAVFDTRTWRLIRSVEVGQGISRVAMQPDGRLLWIAYDGNDSGVSVLDVQNLQLIGKVKTGTGRHELAFSLDSHLVFVTNTESGTITVLDSSSRSKIHEISAGHPGAIAFSAKSSFAYVANVQDGTIIVIDGVRGIVIATIQAEPGLGEIRFARDGRFAIVLNPVKKRIHVLDSSLNRIVQTGDTDGQPEQVSFSSTLAHIRQRGSESVLMIPLDSIGQEQKPLPEAEFPGGQHAFGQAFIPADSIVQAPGENAVLVANAGDRSVYYYEEGMAAPIGLFSTGSHEPSALLALDRSLKPGGGGVYETSTNLKRPGLYTVALLLDSPPAVQCWDVTVQTDPNHPQPVPVHLELQGLVDEESIQAGVPVKLRFRIWDSDAKKARVGANDVKVLLFRLPGVWHEYIPAQGIEGGVYEVSVSSLDPGTYYLNAASPSLGLALQGAPVIFQVVAK